MKQDVVTPVACDRGRLSDYPMQAGVRAPMCGRRRGGIIRPPRAWDRAVCGRGFGGGNSMSLFRGLVLLLLLPGAGSVLAGAPETVGVFIPAKTDSNRSASLR